MIKGAIHKEDKHHKQLDTLTTKKQIHKPIIRRNIKKRKKQNHSETLNFSENNLSSSGKIRIGDS